MDVGDVLALLMRSVSGDGIRGVLLLFFIGVQMMIGLSGDPVIGLGVDGAKLILRPWRISGVGGMVIFKSEIISNGEKKEGKDVENAI